MRYACVRCFRVSVGTRMKADSTAPAEADTRCVSACLHCLRSSRALHSSYVLKYTRAVGSVPSTAPVSPKYTSRGPCSTAAGGFEATDKRRTAGTSYRTMTARVVADVNPEVGPREKGLLLVLAVPGIV